MDSIEQLLATLSTNSSSDPITRISLSPWTWLLLWASVSECWYVDSGFSHDEPGSHTIGVGITIDWTQDEAFRLWNREGREVHGNHGDANALIRGSRYPGS